MCTRFLLDVRFADLTAGIFSYVQKTSIYRAVRPLDWHLKRNIAKNVRKTKRQKKILQYETENTGGKLQKS